MTEAAITVQEALHLQAEPDSYPNRGNKDGRTADRIEKAAGATSLPGDPPKYGHWLAATLAHDIPAAGAKFFSNHYRAYATDIAGEINRALYALHTDTTHRRYHDDFVTGMVYANFRNSMEYS